QLVTIDGKRQCLLLGDRGLTAVDPDTGKVLWEHGREMPGAPRCVQPHRIGRSQLVVGTLDGPGVALIDVAKRGKEWEVSSVWSSSRLKPEFPDFVVHQGYAYGFDG